MAANFHAFPVLCFVAEIGFPLLGDRRIWHTATNSFELQRPVSVFMNIVLWLKCWYLEEKPVLPPKYMYQWWYLYKSPREMETKLVNVCQRWYWVLILDGHSKEFYLALWATLILTQEESYQLYHVKKLVVINKIPVNTASAEIQGF
jgi:hypothetical protein